MVEPCFAENMLTFPQSYSSIRCIILSGLLVLVHSLQAKEINSLEGLIERFLEANGGYENIRAKNSIRLEIEHTADGETAQMILIKKRPDYGRIVYEHNGATIKRAVYKGRGWFSFRKEQRLIINWMPYAEAKSFYGSMFFEITLLRGDSPQVELEFVGKTLFEREEAYEVRVKTDFEAEHSIFIHAIDFYELGKISTKKVGLFDVELKTVQSQFKKVGGIWVGHLFSNYEDDVLLESGRIKSVEFNVGAPSLIFEAPSQLVDKAPDPPYEIDYYISEEDEEDDEGKERAANDQEEAE